MKKSWKRFAFFGVCTEARICDRGFLTAKKYAIFRNEVVLYVLFIRENCLFMRNNARPHVARNVFDNFNFVEMSFL